MNFLDKVTRSRQRDEAWRSVERFSKYMVQLRRIPLEAGFYRRNGSEWLRWELSDQFEVEVLKFQRNPDLFENTVQPLMTHPDFHSYRTLNQITAELFGSESNEEFAALILHDLQMIKLARKARFSSTLEVLCYYLGRRVSTWELKLRAEQIWAIVERVKQGGRTGAESRYHLTKAQQRDRVMATLKSKRDAGMGMMDARRATAKHHRIAVRTVQRYEKTAGFEWTVAPTVHS